MIYRNISNAEQHGDIHRDMKLNEDEIRSNDLIDRLLKCLFRIILHFVFYDRKAFICDITAEVQI